MEKRSSAIQWHRRRCLAPPQHAKAEGSGTGKTEQVREAKFRDVSDRGELGERKRETKAVFFVVGI